MPCETLGIDRRRRDDHFQIWPASLDALQISENEIDVETALVRFVDDQRVVGPQAPVAANLVEQDAVGHHFDRRRGIRAVREPYFEPNGAADLCAKLLGESRSHRVRGDPAGLRVAYHAEHAAPRLEADLRELGRLAAARVPAHHYHAMRLQRLEDRRAGRRDRQRIRVGQREARGTTARD